MSEPEKDGEVTFHLISKFSGRRCEHSHILVDEALWSLTCEDCGEKIDPIAYIVGIANQEAMAEYKVDRLRVIEKEIMAKTICKCEHCGKMTHIPHKATVF
jgi:ribosomal protein S27E